MSAARTLRDHLASQLDAEPERWHLGPGPVRIEPVLNWGGFVNTSFPASSATRRLHVKLAPAGRAEELRGWFAVHEHLTRHYCAPRVLGWLHVPAAGREGIVFEHIDGETWDVSSSPERVTEVIQMLDRLHRDDVLAAQLGDGVRTYRQCWEMRYREQFEEDLRTVRASVPPFVTYESLAWMEDESRKLLALGQSHPALDGRSHALCHWDLWWGNVLVPSNDEGRGAIRIFDWDGLSVGDEALDFATALWANVMELDQDWRSILGRRDERFADRLELHLRAITLDWTIDVLADWIDADVTEWGEQVRARNERLHLRHAAWYRQRWGGRW